MGTSKPAHCSIALNHPVGAEVLPIFLAVIQEHRDAASRDTLTHALFNLVKKPNGSQRQLIVQACVDLAGRIGPSRTAEELLPQAWEQVCPNQTLPASMRLIPSLSSIALFPVFAGLLHNVTS